MTPSSGSQAFVKSAGSSREDIPKVGFMNLMDSREFQRKNGLGLVSPKSGPRDKDVSRSVSLGK